MSDSEFTALEAGVIKAAKNLVAMKGRHNTEIAYKRLADAVKALEVAQGEAK